MITLPPEFQRAFEPGSVRGYMTRLAKEIGTRLMAKGFSVDIIIVDHEQFLVKMTDYRRRSEVVHVQCNKNALIEWRLCA